MEKGAWPGSCRNPTKIFATHQLNVSAIEIADWVYNGATHKGRPRPDGLLEGIHLIVCFSTATSRALQIGSAVPADPCQQVFNALTKPRHLMQCFNCIQILSYIQFKLER